MPSSKLSKPVTLPSFDGALQLYVLYVGLSFLLLLCISVAGQPATPQRLAGRSAARPSWPVSFL